MGRKSDPLVQLVPVCALHGSRGGSVAGRESDPLARLALFHALHGSGGGSAVGRESDPLVRFLHGGDSTSVCTDNGFCDWLAPRIESKTEFESMTTCESLSLYMWVASLSAV